MVELSQAQELAIAITPKCTASLSIPCSCFIIYETICDYRRGRSNAIQRALLGMSFIDILASSGWWLSTWAVPRGEFALAAGNTASCNYQGFLLQLAIGAPLYNSSLALYYLLVIKYRWSNEQLQVIETWTHLLILTFSFGTGFALLPLGLYNHVGAVCWVMGSPPQCGNSSYQPSDVPCERGDYAYLYGIALFYGPLWICVLACITSMVVIYFEVRKTHERLRRYSSVGRAQIHSLRRSATDTNLVATQAILYSLSFFITWTPSTVWSIAHWFNVQNFWLDYAAAFCEPLQGFWNCLIFLRRRQSSQEKIRMAINTLIPCICKEPVGKVSATTGSGHSGHFTRGRRSGLDGIRSSERHSESNVRFEEDSLDVGPISSSGFTSETAPGTRVESSERTRAAEQVIEEFSVESDGSSVVKATEDVEEAMGTTAEHGEIDLSPVVLEIQGAVESNGAANEETPTAAVESDDPLTSRASLTALATIDSS